MMIDWTLVAYLCKTIALHALRSEFYILSHEIYHLHNFIDIIVLLEHLRLVEL